jgi:O-antigen ligase
VALLAIGLGASPLFDGLYATLAWGPSALACAAVLLAGVLARTIRLPAAAGTVAGALLAMGVLCLVSSLWADDDAAALIEAARWSAYAVLLLTLLSLVRSERARRLLHVCLAGTVAVVAVYIEGHLLRGAPRGWFVGRRLNEPVGYFNGQAAYAIAALWLIIGATERRGSGITRAATTGAGVALSVLLTGEVLLTATRAAWPALLVSGLVVILLFTGRARRGWMLVFVAGGSALGARTALDVYEGPPQLVPAAADVHHAALLIALGAVCAGVAYVVADLAASGFFTAARARTASYLNAGLAVVVVGIAVVGLAAGGWHRLHRQADDFVSLREVPTNSSRLFSGGGNRYDYWRVAWKAWRRHPAGGVGAGNYAQIYYRDRRQAEAIRQPHSLELQALSETGLIGGLVIVVLFVGLALSVRGFSRNRLRAEQAGIAVGATGVLVGWVVQTSVDWLHLLPGITGIALASVVLMAPADRRPPRPLGPVLASAAVVLALFCVGRVVLAEHYLDAARADARAGRTAKAEAQVAHALRFEPDAADAYYLRASILASLDRYRQATDTLLVVARDQPRNYLPWELVGDLALRRGERAVARDAYRRAIARNPLDGGLRQRLAQAQ